MWHLNERVRRDLKREGAEELLGRIDRCVQEHPRLCYADGEDVGRSVVALAIMDCLVNVDCCYTVSALGA